MSALSAFAKSANLILPLAVALAVCSCRKQAATGDTMSKVPIKEAAKELGIQPADLPDHAVLYEAITKFISANQGRAAQDVEELVKKGFLKPLPPLPAGKRYHLDQRAAVLSILDK